MFGISLQYIICKIILTKKILDLPVAVKEKPIK